MSLLRDLPFEQAGERRETYREGAAPKARLSGSGKIEVFRASELELPDFELDSRSRDTGRESPREVLLRFAPEEAGLPAISREEAPRYVRDHKGEHPWLKSAEGLPPEAQHPLVAMDLGNGHAGERHEGHLTSSDLKARVTHLEDPAQLDPSARGQSLDAYRKGIHTCDYRATQIWNPNAFATAFARGVEHPEIRGSLEKPYTADERPAPASVRISDLLGRDGHKFCGGFQLVEVGGLMRAAMDCRAAWVDARRRGAEPDVPEPKCVPIQTFEGGDIVFTFRHKADGTGYEVSSMFPEPRRRGL